MNSSAGDLEGEGRKVVAAPVLGLPPMDEIDSSGEDVPRVLRALKADKTKRCGLRRFEQWEIDAALTWDARDYVPSDIPGSPTHQDDELKELRDRVVEVMGLSREWSRQYQALVRQEYEAKGYVDMEFIDCADDFEERRKMRRTKTTQ